MRLDDIDRSRLYTVQQVARMFGLTDKAIYNWLSRGTVRGKRFGNRVRILGEDLVDAFREYVSGTNYVDENGKDVKP